MADKEAGRPLLGEDRIATAEEDEPEIPCCGCRSENQLITVEPVLALYVLAYTAYQMLMEQFLYSVISDMHNVTSIVRQDVGNNMCEADIDDPMYLKHEVIQAEMTYWMLYLNLSTSVPAMFVTLAFGSTSDTYSRKLPIILPVIASISQITTCLMLLYFKLSISILFLASILEGLFGSFPTLLMACSAYTGDTVSNQNRSLRMAFNQICVGLGSASAELTLGIITRTYGFIIPLLIVLCIQLINITYVAFLLPEPKRHKSRAKWSLRAIFIEPFTKMLYRETLDQKYMLRLTLGITTTFSLASMGRISIQILFLQDFPFCWNAKMVGITVSVSALLNTLGTICPVVLLNKWLGDAASMLLSTCTSTISMVVMAFSVTENMVFLSWYI